MKNKTSDTSEDGFSLVEILLVISITGITAWLAMTVYLFGQRHFVNWNENLKLQNELHVILQGITEDMYRAEQVVDFDENRLTLLTDTQKENVYHVKEGSLFKNEQQLTGHNMHLSAFTISAHPKETSSTLNRLNQAETGKFSFFEISLSLTNGRDTLSATRAVHLRKPSNWNLPDRR